MHTAEVKGYIYGVINRQKYEFPVFTGKITHAQTVCTRPFLLPSKGLGTRLVIVCPVSVIDVSHLYASPVCPLISM